MPLNAGGPISMGGSNAETSINIELDKTATARISLNDTDARGLAKLTTPGGTISLENFYGKSLYTYGQEEFTVAGTYEWVCPSDVSTISVICVGAGGGGDAGSDLLGVGGGGGGGALAYRNTVAVVPGQTYTIEVGAGGLGQITVNRTTTQNSTNGGQSSAFSCIAGGGSAGTRGTAQVVIGSQNASGGQISGVYTAGFAGGIGGTIDTSTTGFRPPGGGGAAGYSGVGGYGGRGQRTSPSTTSASFAGNAAATNSGGGGGGGAGYTDNITRIAVGAMGGGVGIYGKGSTGAGGAGGTLYSAATAGGDGSNDFFGLAVGAGGGGGVGGDNRSGSNGMDGAVRIIWPGHRRLFPSTGVANA